MNNFNQRISSTTLPSKVGEVASVAANQYEELFYHRYTPPKPPRSFFNGCSVQTTHFFLELPFDSISDAETRYPFWPLRLLSGGIPVESTAKEGKNKNQTLISEVFKSDGNGKVFTFDSGRHWASLQFRSEKFPNKQSPKNKGKNKGCDLVNTIVVPFWPDINVSDDLKLQFRHQYFAVPTKLQFRLTGSWWDKEECKVVVNYILLRTMKEYKKIVYNYFKVYVFKLPVEHANDNFTQDDDPPYYNMNEDQQPTPQWIDKHLVKDQDTKKFLKDKQVNLYEHNEYLPEEKVFKVREIVAHLILPPDL